MANYKLALAVNHYIALKGRAMPNNKSDHHRLFLLTQEYDGTNPRVFEEIVTILRPRLKAHYLKVSGWAGNQHMDEAIARTLVRLSTKFIAFQPNSSYAPYRYAISVMRRENRNMIKRERNRPHYSLEGLTERYPGRRTIGINEESPEDILIKEENLEERKKHIVERVPQYCRPMLKMLFQGLPGKEIRARLELTKGSWLMYSCQIKKSIREYDDINNRPASAGVDGHGGR